MIRSDTNNSIYRTINSIITNTKLYSPLNDKDTEHSVIYQYIKNEFDELNKMAIIQSRYEEYKKYRDEKILQRNTLIKYEKWNTFSPPLEYSSLLLETDVLSKISLPIKQSNKLLYEYYNVINNYNEATTYNKADTKIRYTTFILFDNIQSNYIQSMIKQNPNIENTYNVLRELYKKYINELADEKMGIEYIISKISGRDIQDYMDINKALLIGEPDEKHEEIIKKSIENRWLQFNTIIYLDKDEKGNRIGKRRIYKELEDTDYELLSELYTNENNIDIYDEQIREYLYTQLKNKYPNYPDDLINFKIEVIIHMNNDDLGSEGDKSSDIKKLSATYDIISNQFKTDIINRIKNEMMNMTTEEIEKLLIENDRYSYEQVGTLISYRSQLDIEEKYKEHSRKETEAKYINDEIRKILEILNIELERIGKLIDNEKIGKFIEDLIMYSDKFSNEEVESFGDNLDLLYGEIIGNNIRILVNDIIIGESNDIKYMLENLGSMKSIYTELINNLYETLKIEGIIDEQATLIEDSFRKNIYMNTISNIELRNLRMICEICLFTIYKYKTLNTTKEILNRIKYEDWINILNSITSLENIYNNENIISNISVINPQNIKQLLHLLCLILIKLMKDSNIPGGFKLIMDHLKLITRTTNVTNKYSYDIMKLQRAKENENRKNAFKRAKEEYQIIYKLSRKIGTGKSIGIIQEVDSTMTAEQQFLEEHNRLNEQDGRVYEEDPDANEIDLLGDDENEYDDD
jgi:hypothetical protein